MAPAASECLHCRAPVTGGAPFCCAGCEAVYTALQAGGLDDYYRLRDVDRDALIGVAARPRDAERYAYLDTDAYRASHCSPLQFVGASGPEAGHEATWAVEGMTCVACAWVIEEVGKRHPGVRDVRVDLMRREVVLRFDAGAALAELAVGIGQFGYGVALPGQRQDQASAGRKELVNLAIAGAIAGNTMMLTLPYYTGLETGRYAALFGWFSLALATVSVLVPGRVFFSNALAALRMGLVSLDLPIGLGVAAAWVYSVVQTLRGAWHELYFDSLTVLVFALLVGRFFQSRAVDRAVARARLLAATMPQLVQALRQGAWQEIAPEAIVVGDRLRVLPGQGVPCESRLLVGPAAVDLQVTTGEEVPRELASGAALPAGARAVDDALEVEALGPAVRVDAHSVPVGGGLRRTPMLADRLGASFTAAVVAVAAGAFAWWTWQVGVGEGLRVAMTVLIVACPCAIGLATPVTAALTIAAAAREGVLVREPSVLDRLAHVRTVVFDKTGTLTEGRPDVVDAWWATADVAQVQAALHDIEHTSRHPVARGVSRWLEGERAAPPQAPLRVRAWAGEGIEGTARGCTLSALALGASERRGWALPPATRPWVDRAHAGASSVVAVWQHPAEEPAAGGAEAAEAPADRAAQPALVALLALADALRSDAAATVADLQARWHLRATLLSGDNAAAVAGVAERLGLSDARAEVAPEAKAAVVAELERSGPVVMVGDGYNDVPALRGASLAMTLASATPGAIAASEVVLHGGGLAGLSQLFDRAARARRVIGLTLAFAAVYNLVGVTLAATGQITPLLAALLMPLSSATVVGVAVWASRRTQSAV